MEGKRSHAVYCCRTCKTKASDVRRRLDGRARQRDRARYEAEAERRREMARRYLQERPGYAAQQRWRRKARKRAVPNYRFTRRDWERLLDHYRRSCAWCGRSGVPLQRDHVIPLVRGGAHGVGNIVPACARCNLGKRADLAIAWRRRLKEEGGDARPHPFV